MFFFTIPIPSRHLIPYIYYAYRLNDYEDYEEDEKIDEEEDRLELATRLRRRPLHIELRRVRLFGLAHRIFNKFQQQKIAFFLI
jgi:hypothetical protein